MRATSYRSQPTKKFLNLLAMVQTTRLFLVNENGPTMLTLEDEKQQKFKITIGSEITCSCKAQGKPNGDDGVHCLHSVFALLKIFRVKPQDPMMWQDSYLDTEIAKILDQRDKAIIHDMNRYQVYAHGGVRQAAHKMLQEQAKKDKEAMLSDKKLG